MPLATFSVSPEPRLLLGGGVSSVTGSESVLGTTSSNLCLLCLIALPRIIVPLH